jgi:signal transduction histidine kinase
MSARKTAARYRWLRFAKLSCPSWFGSWCLMAVTLLLSAMLFGVLHWIHGQCDESNGCLLNHGAWLELLLGWFFIAFVLWLWTKLKPLPASSPIVDHLGMSLLAHEFKRPLQRLVFAVDALKPERVLSEQEQRWFAQAERSFKELERLLDESVFLARMDHGALALQNRHFELQPWLQSLIDECMAEEPQCEWTIQPGTSTPSSFRADSYWLSRALQNILLNAAKHGAKQGLVRWQWHATGLTLSVHDNGPGIEPELKAQIFTPFIGRDRPTGKQSAGDESSDILRHAAMHSRGLGLSLVDGIVRAHGGHVEVCDSELGGCALVISLRLSPELQ